MSKQIDEQISAFMDGELHESEHANLIHQICHDDDLKGRWQSYHLISDTLKNNVSCFIAADSQFAQSVMAALDNEPTVFAPSALKHKANMRQKIAGVAIAASVAAVAVIGVQSMNQPKEEAAPSLAEMPSTDQFVHLEQSQPSMANASSTLNVPAMNAQAMVSPMAPALKASASQSTGTLENVQQDPNVNQIYQYNPQLYKYLLNHNQYTFGSHVQGVMPYARIVVSPAQPQLQEQGR